jgi:hypothetical protein
MFPTGDITRHDGVMLPTYDFVLGIACKARGSLELGVGDTGINAGDWTGRVDAGVLVITSPLGVETSVISVGVIESITFAFDRTMRPTVCWNTKLNGAYLYWFNSLSAAYETLHLPTVRNAMVAHDDTRDWSSASSDVLLAYQVEDLVCYRQQRDRYQIEYVIAVGIEKPNIKKFGMCTDLHVRVKLS